MNYWQHLEASWSRHCLQRFGTYSGRFQVSRISEVNRANLRYDAKPSRLPEMPDDALKFYMDESGFTGEYLMSREQPVFVHVSTTLSAARSAELYGAFFQGTQAPELKHAILARRPAGRERILRFIEAIGSDDRASFTSWLVHKEFALLTYLVDTWVESAAYLDGIDLYQDGANLAMCNMAYFCLPAFQGEHFLHGHLLRFQSMMMKRTPASYAAFWSHVHADYERADDRTREILTPFLHAGMKLGFAHLLRLPKRAIDPALTTAVCTCGHWRKTTELPLDLIHDRSSSLAKDKELWDRITSPDVDRMTLGIPGRDTAYPLNVRGTTFADSKAVLQLQFCDLLAGAAAAWARNRIGAGSDQDYADRLEAAGIGEFEIGSIWPAPAFDPDALGMRGWSGKYADAVTEQLAKLDKSGKSPPDQ